MISYWQFITADKNSMAQAYFTATRKMEEGETNSLGSLFVSLYTEHVLNNECLSQHIHFSMQEKHFINGRCLYLVTSTQKIF